MKTTVKCLGVVGERNNSADLEIEKIFVTSCSPQFSKV